jgi:iron complex outermembrane receptor protein
MSHLFRLIAVLLGFVLAAGAAAQGSILEEVVVTAQKREQSLQDVPISVNVIGGDKLDEVGIKKIDDLQAYVPNLVMSETGIGNNIYIRGIGSGINPGFEQSSAMFVDGVHYGRGQLYRAPLFDMNRIEVLRGPQSILFGKNAIGGAISLTTAAPTDEFEGSVSLMYEPDHGEQEASLILSGPFSESVSGRLAIRKRDMDGYMSNPTLGTDDPEQDELTLRGTLQWTGDRADVTLKYERNEYDTVGRNIEIIDDVYGFPFPIPTNANQIPYSTLQVLGFMQNPTALDVTQNYIRSSGGDTSTNESDNFSLTVNWDFSGFTLTSVSAYLQYEFQELCDCDFSSANVLVAPLAEDYDQFSQELRLVSPGGEAVDWIVGAFYQTNDASSPDATGFAANSILGPVLNALQGPGVGDLFVDSAAARTFTQDTDSIAVFGQVTWNLADTMRLSLGGRFTSEDKDATRRVSLTTFSTGAAINPAVDPLRWGVASAVYAGLLGVQFDSAGHDLAGSRSDDSFDFGVNVQWDASEALMLYANVSTGFKSGGFDTRSNSAPGASLVGIPGVFAPGTLPDGTFEFQEEDALAFEVGVKARIGQRAELNAAVFLTQYEGLQTSLFDGRVGFNVGNADADLMGLELDGRWQLTDNFGLFGSFALLDFEFTKFPNGECYFGEAPPGTQFCNRTGATNQYVADYSGTLGLAHDASIGANLLLRSTLDVTFTDEYFTAQNNDPVTVQDAYAKVNLRIALGIQDGTWEVAVLGRNLTDEDIISYSNPVPLSGTFGANSHYAFIQRPRSVALQGSFRF